MRIKYRGRRVSKIRKKKCDIIYRQTLTGPSIKERKVRCVKIDAQRSYRYKVSVG